LFVTLFIELFINKEGLDYIFFSAKGFELEKRPSFKFNYFTGCDYGTTIVFLNISIFGLFY
jgi:hypothetical protein